jgi:hypothetical protein
MKGCHSLYLTKCIKSNAVTERYSSSGDMWLGLWVSELSSFCTTSTISMMVVLLAVPHPMTSHIHLGLQRYSYHHTTLLVGITFADCSPKEHVNITCLMKTVSDGMFHVKH